MTTRRTSCRSAGALLVTLALVLAACSSDGDQRGSTDGADTEQNSTQTVPTTAAASTTEAAPGTTEAAPTTVTNPPTTVVGVETLDTQQVVEALASDELNGRDNRTPGSLSAQELLVSQLAQFAEPAFPESDGNSGFLQPFDVGTNILAIIPGGDLADEYVMIGAHYDHLGIDCRRVVSEDDICNGATDNATGVAEVMEIARSIAADGPPRRSLIIALWDAEEDGLVGSSRYVNNPVVPLAQTVAYVNFDIHGANLLPSLANWTILVGAETGGPHLVESASTAIEASTLDTIMLSLLFGLGRSDHAVLVGAGVPSVFFTDSTGGCYHTVGDEVAVVDFAKLEQQIASADALTRDLLSTESPPVLDRQAPPSTYDDAAQLLELIAAAEPDFGLLGSEAQATSEQYLIELQGVVDAGPEAFDDAANGIVLVGVAGLVSALADGPCDAYIP